MAGSSIAPVYRAWRGIPRAPGSADAELGAAAAAHPDAAAVPAPVLAVHAARARELPRDLDAAAHGDVAAAGLPVVGFAAHGLRVAGAVTRSRARAMAAPPRDKVAAATVRHPHAAAVVAPAGTLDARRLRQLALQAHATAGIDRAMTRAAIVGFAADPVAMVVRGIPVARIAAVARIAVVRVAASVVIARIAVSDAAGQADDRNGDKEPDDVLHGTPLAANGSESTLSM